jgi:hypothetical protein
MTITGNQRVPSLVGALLLASAACAAHVSAQGNAAAPSTADLSAAPEGRAGHSLVWDDARRMLLLIDGYPYGATGPRLGVIWGWDGARWRRLPGEGPHSRTLSAVAYDSRRGVLVLFGGIGIVTGNRYGDTWEWDGRQWQERFVRGPDPRDHHAMVYDSARGVVVMYGGQNASREWAADTWEWDGREWTRHEVPGPGGRAHHAMAYDSRRGRVVLFGGLGEDREYAGDTWEWDGRAWTRVATEGPPPRARHRMAYDAGAGAVLLHGGSGVKTTPGPGFDVVGDVWSWDGARWTEVAATPGPRFMHAMAYDPVRRRVVSFGGNASGSSPALADLWEWDGRNWTRGPGGAPAGGRARGGGA